MKLQEVFYFQLPLSQCVDTEDVQLNSLYIPMAALGNRKQEIKEIRDQFQLNNNFLPVNKSFSRKLDWNPAVFRTGFISFEKNEIYQCVVYSLFGGTMIRSCVLKETQALHKNTFIQYLPPVYIKERIPSS